MLICVLRLFTIIGSLITSSLGKVEIILTKTSERSQTNLFVKHLISVLQQQHSSGLTSPGVQAQTVNIWVTDFTGVQGFAVSSCDGSAEKHMWDPLYVGNALIWECSVRAGDVSPDMPCALGLVRFQVTPGFKIME